VRTSMSLSRADSPMIMPLYVAECVPMNSVPRTCSSPSACSVVVPSAGGQAAVKGIVTRNCDTACKSAAF
jgi:hypothetical protein